MSVLLEDSLFGFLAADTALAGMLTSPDQPDVTRIYPMVAPQGSPVPRVVYQRVSTQRTETLCATDGKVRAVMDMNCYDKTYRGAKLLANALRQTLIDFSGDMDGTRVSTVILDGEVDLDDPDPGLYRVSQTYFIWFKEQ